MTVLKRVAAGINMIFELSDTSLAAGLFEGWEETLIWSALQGVMGKVFVTDTQAPESAMAFTGCFAFVAGKPSKEIVLSKPEGFVIMVPQNEEWEKVIEECYPDARKVTRYAIKKNTLFDEAYLRSLVGGLPEGYKLCKIDNDIYDLCVKDPVTYDFVSAFGSKEKYLEYGRGVVILRDGKIVAGASSYTRYKEGIEIEVDTVPEERRKGLGSIVAAALIINCLEEGLYPSWDAQNMNSVRMAEKLGYEFDHEYTAYELAGNLRTH